MARSRQSQTGDRKRDRACRLSRSPGASDGFTLLEVLVALTILSISLVALLAAFSQGLDRATEDRTEAAARSLAQSLLAQAESAPNPAAGESSGQSSGLSWRVKIVPYGSGDDQTAWKKTAAQISATVAWRDDGHPRSLTLSTLRLVPGEQSQ